MIRHRVVRQLRHLMRERLELFGPGTFIAVRALPSASGATSSELADDLDLAINRAQHKIRGQEET